MENKHIEDLEDLVSHYMREIEEQNKEKTEPSFISIVNEHIKEDNNLYGNSSSEVESDIEDNKAIHSISNEKVATEPKPADVIKDSMPKDNAESNSDDVYDIKYPKFDEIKQPEEKIIEKIVTYEKLPKKLWTKILCLVLACSLLSGILGGYIADNFHKENVVVEKVVQDNTVAEIKSVSFEDVIDEARKSSVEIIASKTTQDYFGRKIDSASSGSGVIINAEGFVITNHHVVKNSTDIKITDISGKTFTATLVGSDERSDIAVLKIDSDETFDYAKIGDSSSIRVGQSVIVIGNPLGTLGGSATTGIVSALDRDIYLDGQYQTLIQTDATINSGNSGGGLFDANGNLIGIINAKDSGFTSNGTIIEGIGFAIPINKALDIAEQLMAYGEVNNRVSLGVEITEALLEDGSTEIYISKIYEGSSADLAGLKVEDRIVSVNGEDVDNFVDLYKIIDSSRIGDVLEFEIERNKEPLKITVSMVNNVIES